MRITGGIDELRKLLAELLEEQRKLLKRGEIDEELDQLIKSVSDELSRKLKEKK